MLGFNDFDEEEMLDLLAAALVDLVAAGGQFLVAGDVLVGSSEPMDSGARGDSSAAEVPEENVDTRLG